MPDYRKIKLIILDVDGTLTDGGIYYDAHGNEMKRFDVKDGLGIKVGISAGLEFSIITGRESSAVNRRAAELGIQHVVQGVQKKFSALQVLAESCGLSMEEIGYIGDDINDLQSMEVVGFRACPHNASPEVKEICHYIAEVNGGYGAVRDCIEFLLKQREQWNTIATSLYYV